MAPGLRERKKERTRTALETAALELFDRQGYDVTTVEQIADAGDVSTRTFFRYYPTKADVLLRDQVGRRAMVEAFLAEQPADRPLMESLQALLRAIADDLPSVRHLLQAQFRYGSESEALLAAVRNHHAQIIDLLTDFIASRLDHPDPVGVQARAIANAYIGACVAVAGEWIVEGPEGSKPNMEAAITSLTAQLHVPG